MEGGNKYPFNLSAPLEVSTSDMFVSVNQATVQHNWQRYQGKYMPNSLRFEMNGWAADWNVFNFEYETGDRIKLADDLYVSAIDFNTLGLYPSEISQDLLYIVPFTRDFKLIYRSNDSISFNDSTGLITGDDYTVSWDISTQTPELHTLANKSLEYSVNADNSYTFNIIDNDKTFEFNETIYLPDSIKSLSLLNSVKYDYFEEDVHHWVDGTAYNSNTDTLTIPGVQGSVEHTVTGNKLSYNYSKLNAADSLLFSFSYAQYVTQFTGLKGPDNKLISTAAEPRWALNEYSVTFDPSTLTAGSSTELNIGIPIYFSIRFTDKVAGTTEALYANNVAAGNVRVKTGARNTLVTATSVYDNTAVTTGSENVIWQSPSDSKRLGLFPLTLNYRYNKIEVGNTIHPGVNFSPYRYIISGVNVWLFNANKYRNIRTASELRKIGPLLGNIYDIKKFYTPASNILEYNDIFDYKKANSAIYTEQDLQELRSIKGKGEQNSIDSIPDTDYIASYIYDSTNEIAFCNNYCAELTGTPGIYNVSDPAKTLSQLYSTVNGYRTYIGGTYIQVNRTLTYDSDFFPFEYIPCFNYNDNGTTVTGVLHVRTDGTYITDFDEYKEELLGVYDEANTYSMEDELVFYNTAMDRSRIVNNYAVVYDWDTVTGVPDWYSWYPLTNSPETLITDLPVQDLTYFDYFDITINTNVQPEITFTAPGIALNGGYSLNCFNIDDLVLYHLDNTDVTHTPEVKVYHHNVDKTSDYTIIYGNEDPAYMGSCYPGQMSVNNVTYYLPTFYGYGANQDRTILYKPKSMFLTKVTRNVDNFVIKQTYTDTVTSGCLNTVIYSKNNKANVTWLDRVHVTAMNGRLNCYDNYNAGAYGNPGPLMRVPASDVKGYWLSKNNISGVYLTVALTGYIKDTVSYSEVSEAGVASEHISIVQSSTGLNSNRVYVDRDNYYRSLSLFEFATPSVTLVSDRLTIEGSLQPTIGGGAFYYLPTVEGDEALASVVPVLPFISTESPLLTSSEALSIGLIGTAKVNNVPEALTVIGNKGQEINHVFYKDSFDLLTANSNNFTINTNLSTFISTVSVPIFNTNVSFTMNDSTGVLSLGSDVVINVNGTNVTVVHGNYSEAEGLYSISITEQLNFANVQSAFISMPNTDGFTLLSCINNICSINNESRGIIFDYNILTQISNTYSKVQVTKPTVDSQLVYILAEAKDTVTAFMCSILDDTVIFTYDGNSYSVDLNNLSFNNNVLVMSTDIRESDKTDVIGKIKSDNEFQLIKQQWNSTIEVENFWWVDSKHILELTQYEFIYKRKTSELDDWNGDRFEDIYRISRANILPSDIKRWLVPNVYNTDRKALLLTFELVDNAVVCYIRDIENELNLLHVIGFQFNRHELGQILNDKTPSGNNVWFNTYNIGLQEAQLLSQATWSATIIDDRLILGCHLMNNYDQWTTVIRLNDYVIEKCIQGYGWVGLKGELTGGQLPDMYFNPEYGFTGRVDPVDTLPKTINKESADKEYEVQDISEIYNVEERIVGTTEQQWYITNTVHGIVSHLTYAGAGRFEKAVIPLTNNYSAIYKSPSYLSEIMGDIGIQAYPFADLVPSGTDNKFKQTWKAMCVVAGWPTIFLFAPRLSSVIYLQQTIGQYAYVHYNSHRERPRKELDSTGLLEKHLLEQNTKTINPNLYDEYSFDKQIVRQTGKINSAVDGTLKAAFLMSVMPADFMERAIANPEQMQVAAFDVGKKYAQFAEENLAGVLDANLRGKGPDCGLTSTVVGLKNLDMFYSTSDTQRVFAGPGFVEHQFVADCVAQSATDLHLNGSLLQMTFIFKELTTWLLRTELTAAQSLFDSLHDTADWTHDTEVSIFGNATNAAGITAAILQLVGISAAYIAKELLQLELDLLEGTMDILAKNVNGLRTIDPLATDVPSYEGTHKYGEKHETFMWPCWGIPVEGLEYTDEYVEAGIKESSWELNYSTRKKYRTNPSAAKVTYSDVPKFSSVTFPNSITIADNIYTNHQGAVPVYRAACIGKTRKEYLPKDMAKIEGVETFLPGQAFKNENIGMSEPVFTASFAQDFVIDERWQLSQYCTYGQSQWVTCKDTKLIDCPPSNMVVNNEFCGIASPYTAVEVKRGISKAYMRPWAVTPNTLAFNVTGYNCIHDNKMYHGFDGISYRLVEWTGSPGMNKNFQTMYYCFQLNDRFKRSNKLPPNELLGNFVSDPIQYINTIDKIWPLVTVPSTLDTNDTVGKGTEGGTVGEDKDDLRFSLPMFTEQVNTLPAAIKTLTAHPLMVVEGLTSLTTALMNNQTAYKAPVSVDFTIGKNVYRVTKDYISSVTTTHEGIDVVNTIVPVLGLKFVGSTPSEAFFYSDATRCYYTFSGSNLTKIDMIERFRNVISGHYDFVNQEVVMPCLTTYTRLNEMIKDDDTETDNIIVPVLAQQHIKGELPPPITTIFNDRSWYKVVSLPSGLTYQGPNRVIINRAVFVNYMLGDIKSNLGKWKRLDREHFDYYREYSDVYKDVTTDVTGVKGWTYNPFIFVTSPIGTSEYTDNMYEWEITFCWPIEMDLIYGIDNFAVVNIAAETMTPGGKVMGRPTHVFLTKELFTNKGNYGYYSFKFQSKNGIGNRERLHIWSDQYIAISSLACDIKPITTSRTEQLTQQVDVRELSEL